MKILSRRQRSALFFIHAQPPNAVKPLVSVWPQEDGSLVYLLHDSVKETGAKRWSVMHGPKIEHFRTGAEAFAYCEEEGFMMEAYL